MKKYLKLVISLMLIIAVFAGCSMSSPAAEAPATPEAPAATTESPAVSEDGPPDEIVIGYSPLTMEFEVFRDSADIMTAAAEEYGNARVIISDPQNDSMKQATGVEQMLSAGADVIVMVAIDTTVANTIAADVHDKGKYIIGYACTFDDADVCSGVDEYTFGFLQGEGVGKWIAENYDGQGVVAVLDADDLGGVLLNRSKGMIEGILSQAPDSKIQKTTAWSEADGMAAVETLTLENPDINFVAACNDPGAFGAIAALESKGLLDKVKVASIGSETRTMQMVADGRILLTIHADMDGGALEMFNTAIKLMNGESVDYVSIPVTLIDQAEAKARLGLN